MILNVDANRCTSCGLCAGNCPQHALHMEQIPVVDELRCMRCQHCLAICPTGAISIMGHAPENCLPLKGHFPDPKSLETLIRGRRSIRRFVRKNVEPDELSHLLSVAAHAPTASNRRALHLTILDDMNSMNAFREELYRRLSLPEIQARLENNPRKELLTTAPILWKENGTDRLLHNAPHCIIVSNHRESGYNLPVDPVIFLTTFELMAQTCGIGTLWCGMLYSCLEFVLPELRDELGIPKTHAPQYAMLFGYPDITYPRSVQHDPYPRLSLHRAKWDAN